MTGALHGLKHFDMHPAFSNNLISSSRNLWYFDGIGYGFHDIGGPAVEIFI